MSCSKCTMLAIASLVVPLTIHDDVANAQCSRGGGRGGSATSLAQVSPTLSSASPFFAASSFENVLASRRASNLQQQQMLAMQQQMQQQFLAFRQQQIRQLASEQQARQQEIHATRLARAEQKRAKRAERIAAMKAKRSSTPEASGIMLASEFPSEETSRID